MYVDVTAQAAGFDAQELAGLRAVRVVVDPHAGEAVRDAVVAELTIAGLEQRGVAADPDAEVLLYAHGYVVESERELPPEPRHSPYWPMVGRCRTTAGGRTVVYYDPFPWYWSDWSDRRRTVTVYSHRAELALQRQDGRVLWTGELRADGGTLDFLGAMREGIPILLEQYPRAEGVPVERRVELSPRE